MARKGAEALRHLQVKQTFSGSYIRHTSKQHKLKPRESRLPTFTDGRCTERTVYLPCTPYCNADCRFFRERNGATRLKPDTPNAPIGEVFGV